MNPSSPSPQPRLPGGQPGNTNALKHGFYARKFTPENLDDYERARLVTGLDEEIALLRLVILNIAQACLPAPGDSPALAACHALEAALARLSHLLKDQHFLALGTTDPAGIIAALFAEANADLPVTRIFQTAPTTPSPLDETPPATAFPLSLSGRGAGGEGQPSSPLASGFTGNDLLPSSLHMQTLQREGDFQLPLPYDPLPSAEPPLVPSYPCSPLNAPADVQPSLPPSPARGFNALSQGFSPPAPPPPPSAPFASQTSPPASLPQEIRQNSLRLVEKPFPPLVVPRRFSRSSFFPRFCLSP